jgi:uncharacterized protein YjbI with pentapeptide repeats
MELDRKERQYVGRRIGRTPTEEDMRKYFNEERKALRGAQERRELEDEESRRERRRLAEERQAAIAERLATREVEPSAFAPPEDLAHLEAQSKSNQTFGEGARLVGTNEEPLRIALDLNLFNLRSSYFEHVRFTKSARLGGVDFTASIFKEVTFEGGGDLTGVDFREARFTNVVFAEDCKVTRAQFESAVSNAMWPSNSTKTTS